MINRIHQIWLGETIPEDIKLAMISVGAKNLDYEYTLWTDKNLAEFNLQHLVDTDMPKAFIANILRFNILSKYGGWYIDADMECFKPINSIPIPGKLASAIHEYNDLLKYGCGCIYSDSMDFTELLSIYSGKGVIIKDYNDFIGNQEVTDIPTDLVGINGSVLRDMRLNSWRKDK